ARRTTSSSSSRTSWRPSSPSFCPTSSRPSSPQVPSTSSLLLSSLKLPHHIDEAPNGRNRLIEHGLLGLVQVDFDHLLYARSADHDRHADVESLHPVFAIQHGGTGKHAS